MVLPSGREGFLRVLADVMGAGVPLITASYPLSGACELVRRYEVGVTCPPDSVSIGENLVELCGEDSWVEFYRRCLAQAKTLDWGPLVERLRRFLEGLRR